MCAACDTHVTIMYILVKSEKPQVPSSVDYVQIGKCSLLRVYDQGCQELVTEKGQILDFTK